MKNQDNRTVRLLSLTSLTLAVSVLFIGTGSIKLYGCVPNKVPAEPREKNEKTACREREDTHDKGNNVRTDETDPNENAVEAICKLPEGRERLEFAEWTAPDDCFPRPYGGLFEITDEESFKRWFICQKPKETSVDFEKHRILVFLASGNPNISIMGFTKNEDKNEITLHVLDPIYCGRANPTMIRFRKYFKVPKGTPAVSLETCRPQTRCPGGERDTRP